MEVNILKSSINFNCLREEVELSVRQLFHFRLVDLQEGLKYLGFILTPNGYDIKDWGWLIIRIEEFTFGATHGCQGEADWH